MGSLHGGDGIPVVPKNSHTFRLRDGTMVYKTDSTNDAITDVAVSPEDNRTSVSGSIVRADGTVEYKEVVVVGMYRGGRNSDERIASKIDDPRNLNVDLAGNQTVAVIPPALVPHNPQLSIRHIGNTISVQQSVDDSVVARHPASGVHS